MSVPTTSVISVEFQSVASRTLVKDMVPPNEPGSEAVLEALPIGLTILPEVSYKNIQYF
jgi:hypothetical protein